MSDYTTDWHLLIEDQQRLGMPYKSNVYCLNGSAHIHITSYYGSTTCPKCKRIYKGKSTATEEAQRAAKEAQRRWLTTLKA